MRSVADMNRLVNLCCHLLNDHALCPPHRADANIVCALSLGTQVSTFPSLYRNVSQMQSVLKIV